MRLELSTQGTIEVVVTLETDDARGVGAVAMGAAKAAMGAAAMGAAAMGRAATAPAPHEASGGGTVTVRVVRATGLLAGDKNGYSDPFVVVQSAGDKKSKTSVKKKTLDPEWEETLELSVLDAAAPLSFVVWDHDKVGRNDHLGSAEISLAQIAPGVPTPLRLELSTQGTIEVVVTLVTGDARGVGSVAMGAAKAAMGAAAMGATAMSRAATAPAPHEASGGGTVTVPPNDAPSALLLLLPSPPLAALPIAAAPIAAAPIAAFAAPIATAPTPRASSVTRVTTTSMVPCRDSSSRSGVGTPGAI